MKKTVRKFFRIIILSMLLVFMSGCAKEQDGESITLYSKERCNIPFESRLKIAVASDFHRGNNSASQNGESVNYREEIYSAFADEIKNGPNVVILCGDNSNNGKISEHERLAEKLKSVEDAGVTVLTIPGNHDIGSTTAADFERIYRDFGYTEAHSRDENSLSYTYLYDNVMLLMLDTDGYTDYNSGNISEETLQFAETRLSEAKDKGLTVLAFGHFPLITQNRIAVNNGDKMLALFEKYGVQLYVAGHMHNRNVNIEGGVTELVVERTSVYPFGYAEISLNENNDIMYNPWYVNVQGWMTENRPNDSISNKLNYQAELERAEQIKNTVETLCKGHNLNSKEIEDCREFYSILRLCYSEGKVFSNKEMLQSHDGYKIFEKVSKGTNYERWFVNMFENCSNYTEFFTISDGKIY